MEPGKRGKKPTGRGGSDPKVPPFKRGEHQVTHAQARRMRKRFLALVGSESELGRPAVYSRNIFDKILAQQGCEGVRFYPGIGDDGKMTMLFCGVDAMGNDMLQGVIGDSPWWCPPFCSGTNGVLQF